MLSRSIYLVLFFINYSCSNLPEGFVYINDLDNRINIDFLKELVSKLQIDVEKLIRNGNGAHQ